MSTRRILATAIALAMVIAGCATRSAEAPPALTGRQLAEVQRSASRTVVAADRPTVALVLGGGGLRGFAHVGVLRALEEAGIQPDMVVGTSAGAVVGAVYASGMTSAQIETAARDVRLNSLIDWTWSSQGLMRGDSLAGWIDELTDGVPIERFPVRFAAVATDLNSASAILLDSGPAGRAVQASAAVPGINVPVPYAKGHLVDGGVASLVPVHIARAMGAASCHARAELRRCSPADGGS